MRLLVLGAGGIGGYFGGRLAASDVDVQFLVRPSRAEKLAHNGLIIHSPLGNLGIKVRTIAAPNEIFDAVLLACKAYNLEEALVSIEPAIGPDTVILPLLNGVRHFDVLDAYFGKKHVLGGLCHIGVTLDANGEVHHLNNLQRLAFGSRMPEQDVNVAALHKLLVRGGFDPILSNDISQDIWEKFAFLAAYAGLTTLMRAPIGAIASTVEGEAIAREMLMECTTTAAASGHAPRRTSVEWMEATLTEQGSTGTSSMLRDVLSNCATEHEHIIGDMVHRARLSGVAASLLRISLTHMQAYEFLRNT